MFYAKFAIEGKEHAELYDSWDRYHADTFSPLTEDISFVDFNVHGKDYQSRKNCVRDIALDWSNSDTSGLSCLELHRIWSWFYNMGRRYGLLQEFRENCIC